MATPDQSLFAKALRKARTAASRPFSVTLLTGCAWLLLWPARLAVMTIPLRHLVKVFGKDQGVSPAIPLATEAQTGRARWVRQAIATAVRYSPESANCYPQALVARLFLRLFRVPHALFFGIRREPDSDALDAHAWVMSGSLAVTGGHSFGRYTVVRSFLSGPGD